jgi:hypothetical protein
MPDIYKNEADNEYDEKSEGHIYYIKEDYLKYWPPVRYYMIRKYKITYGILDLLLFLYSERRFSKRRLDEICLSYYVSYYQLDYLLRRKFVKVFKEGPYKSSVIYTLTNRSKVIVEMCYDFLEGRKIPPKTFKDNPLLRKAAGKAKRLELLKEISSWAKADKQTAREELWEMYEEDLQNDEEKKARRDEMVKQRIEKTKKTKEKLREAPKHNYRVRVIKPFKKETNLRPPQYPSIE